MTQNREEPVGTCGCRLERTETGLRMAECPLHAQAPAMLSCLQHAVNWAQGFMEATTQTPPWLNEARAILRAVGG